MSPAANHHHSLPLLGARETRPSVASRRPNENATCTPSRRGKVLQDHSRVLVTDGQPLSATSLHPDTNPQSLRDLTQARAQTNFSPTLDLHVAGLETCEDASQEPKQLG